MAMFVGKELVWDISGQCGLLPRLPHKEPEDRFRSGQTTY